MSVRKTNNAYLWKNHAYEYTKNAEMFTKDSESPFCHRTASLFSWHELVQCSSCHPATLPWLPDYRNASAGQRRSISHKSFLLSKDVPSWWVFKYSMRLIRMDRVIFFVEEVCCCLVRCLMDWSMRIGFYMCTVLLLRICLTALSGCGDLVRPSHAWMSLRNTSSSLGSWRLSMYARRDARTDVLWLFITMNCDDCDY